MKISAILIDDEPKALAILQNKLERFCPQIEVITTIKHPSEARSVIAKLNPDIVFLDIAMPEMTGFDVLKTIENPSFEVIFVTAFDHYAIDAINHCAIGYLVKPVDNQDLIATVQKALTNIENKTALFKNKQLIENLGVQKFQDKKIIIPAQDGLEFIAIKNILHCEGTDGYTKIHVQDKRTLLSSQSIGHFKKLLENNEFYLVHKSYLINLNHIEKYLNEGYILLSENYKIPVSRNRRSAFLELLKNK